MSLRDLGEHEAEQQSEEDQTEHLALRGVFEDVLGYQAQEHTHHVLLRASRNLLRNFSGVSRETNTIFRRLPIDNARLDGCDQHQPSNDGQQRSQRVVAHRLEAHAPQLRATAHSSHGRNDRRHDQGHDQHLESAQEQRAEEITDRHQASAEQTQISGQEQPQNDGKDEGDEDLPVELQLRHAAERI